MSSLSHAVARIHCITLEGADARQFAQAQFSADVESLVAGQWQWNAWLTAQGRVQALMLLADGGNDRLLAVLRGGDASVIHTGLSRYLLRSRTKLRVETFTARDAGPAAAFGVRGGDDSVILGFGSRSLHLEPGPPSEIDATAAYAWRLADIEAGWPTLPADAAPRFLSPALGLERLGAVSFDKGCYPGQEITTRLHHRGGHKHMLCHLRGETPLPLGDCRGQDRSIQATVLDAVTRARVCNALAVLTADSATAVAIHGNHYSIQQVFDA